MTYSNGDMYKGTFVNGKRSGNGKYTWANKAVYRGKWEKDKMNGTGTYYYEPTSRGKKLTGKWKNNAPNGTCYYWARTKNKKYTTTWKSGKCVKVKG